MFGGFSPETMKFLNNLDRNNNRDWFQKNKQRYEEVVLGPALELVESMQGPLKTISPYFDAVPKRSGGSIMRIYRDTRFSKDKTPYKTNLGIQFRHEAGRDVHAPGFYFHISPEEVFVGAGIWRPDSRSLGQIRSLMDDDPKRWRRVNRGKKFRDTFQSGGESLKRPPRGYSVDHPLIDDLKRKDHIGLAPLAEEDLYDCDLIDKLVVRYKTALPMMRFLCDAIHLPC